MNEVRIYVEGGGPSKFSKSSLRRGFGQFFEPLRSLARERRTRWNIIMAGSRQNAYKDFCLACDTFPDAFNVLLVDSESPVESGPKEHLTSRDGWVISATADQIHLMAQVMETWFLADIEALRKFYGRDLVDSGLHVNHRDPEKIDKAEVAKALQVATQRTQKREYHKIQHASKLLGLLNPTTVRSRCLHCERFFEVIEAKFDGVTSVRP